jgi:hypothetical protein
MFYCPVLGDLTLSLRPAIDSYADGRQLIGVQMLYVSIGRNVGEVPMDDDMWRNFRISVEECIMDNERAVVADTYAPGTSRWGDMNEECLVLVWFDIAQQLSDKTQQLLAEIATEFKQEAIAWAVVDTQFIEGKVA